MASSSAESPKGGIIEIKVFFKEVTVEKPLKDIAFHIFSGYTSEITLESIGNSTYIFKGYFDRSVIWNEDLSLLSINLTEKTRNELGQICSRNIGDVSFDIVKLHKKHGKNNFPFDKLPIYNHTLDDEIYEIEELKDQKTRIIGYVSGNMTINFFNASVRKNKLARDTNKLVMSKFILPWYDKLKLSAPGGPIVQEINDYHVPVFRLLSGSMLPFSYCLLWKNRYYNEGFEYDPIKCESFVQIIKNLLDASVYFHPEFRDTNDFINRCTQFIKSDSMDAEHKSCIDVIVNMLNLKTASEPYISDEVYVPGLRKKISVDQMSNVNDIYGCDCEDGCKYACELKRLICDSNWTQIFKTMGNDRRIIEIRDTVVRILRMTCAFMSVMYCRNGICHVVMTLVDWMTTKNLIGIEPSTPVSKYEERPLRRIISERILFVETTAYSSPFQLKAVDEEEEDERKKMYYAGFPISKKMEQITHSTEVYEVNPVYDTSSQISSFYRYFTNMMTWELMNVFPNLLDFLPTKGPHWGFSLNDLAYNMEELRLVPRMQADNTIFKLMNEVILSQLPSYDIFPSDGLAPYMTKLFDDQSSQTIERKFQKLIKQSPILQDKFKESHKKQTADYVRMNVYTIDLLDPSKTTTYHDILHGVEEILTEMEYIHSYQIRARRVYSYSKQTIVVNVFFYYRKDNIKLVHKLMEFTPLNRQSGRK